MLNVTIRKNSKYSVAQIRKIVKLRDDQKKSWPEVSRVMNIPQSMCSYHYSRVTRVNRQVAETPKPVQLEMFPNLVKPINKENVNFGTFNPVDISAAICTQFLSGSLDGQTVIRKLEAVKELCL